MTQRFHATVNGRVPFTAEEEQEAAALAASAEQQHIDELGRAARAERGRRLALCDWTQLPDAPANAAAWLAYRQELRDITEQPGFPTDFSWPVSPESGTASA